MTPEVETLELSLSMYNHGERRPGLMSKQYNCDTCGSGVDTLFYPGHQEKDVLWVALPGLCEDCYVEWLRLSRHDKSFTKKRKG